jgi:hypothetical protein
MANITATFGGDTFNVQGADGKSYSSRARIRILRIPGGDQTIIQRNPTSEHTLSLDALVDSAVLASLRSKVGTFETLTHGDTISGSALLLKVEPRRVWRYDLYVTGLTFRIFRGYGFSYGANYGS